MVAGASEVRLPDRGGNPAAVADIDSIVKVGSQIEHTIFRNNERTVYEIVP